MKWSFYEFSELIRENKESENLLSEMPMRQQGDPRQYDVGPSPYKPTTATDGYEGKNTRLNVHDTDQGKALDRAVRGASWDKYSSENPDAAKAFSGVHQLNREEDKAARNDPTTAHDQSTVRRGGGVVNNERIQETIIPEEYYHKLLLDQSPEAKTALKINDFIDKKSKQLSEMSFSKNKIVNILIKNLPEETPESINAGIEKLQELTNDSYFQGTTTGLTINRKLIKQNSTFNFDSHYKGAGQALKMYDDMRSLGKNLEAYVDEHDDEDEIIGNHKVAKICRLIVQIGGQILQGREGSSRNMMEKDQEMKHAYEMAKWIIEQRSSKAGNVKTGLQ